MKYLKYFKIGNSNMICILVSMNVCLGSFILGYELSVYSPCQTSVNYANNWFGVPDEQLINGLLFTSVPMGVLVGVILSNLIQQYSKRMIFIISDIICIVAILISNMKGFNALFLGRLILGITQGSNLVFIPIYIDQVSNKEIKSYCGSLHQFAYQFGVLFSFFMGLILPSQQDLEKGLKQNIYIFVFTWPIILCFIRIFNFTGIFNFDTPYDYYLRNKEPEAKKIIQLLNLDFSQINSDIMTITKTKMNKNLSIVNIFSEFYYKQYFLCILLAILQQLSGINGIIFYLQKILQESLSETASNLFIMSIGIILVVTALISGKLVNQIGYREVFLAGLMVCCISNSVLAMKDYLQLQKQVPMIIIVFILSYGVSIGPLYSMYISQVLPQNLVGSVVTINWFIIVIVAFIFPKFTTKYGYTETFIFHALVCLLGFMYCYCFMVEIHKKNKLQIQKDFYKNNKDLEYLQVKNTE